MDACNACAVAHGMQRRDVAEADNPLWIDFKLVGRYEIGEVDGSVTTSTTKDCFYLGVKNCLSEVVGVLRPFRCNIPRYCDNAHLALA